MNNTHGKIGGSFMCVAALAVLASVAQTTWAQAMRTVTVTARVEQQGQGVADIPLVLQSSLGRIAAGVTNPQGEAVLQGDVSADDGIAFVRVSNGDEEIFAEADRNRLYYPMRVWLDAHCVEMSEVVLLQAEQSNYTVTLSVATCVEVTGRLIPAQGDPVRCAAIPVNAWARKVIAGPPFRAQVMQSTDSSLFVTDGVIGRLLGLSAAQTAQSIDIGDVASLWSNSDSVVNVTATHWSEFSAAVNQKRTPDVTLVRVDGSFLAVSLGAKATRNVNGEEEVTVPPVSVPHGEYFVIPSKFFGMTEQMELLDAIARGDTIPPEIPRVNVGAGATANVLIDLYAAHRALFRLRQPSP